MVNYVGLFQSGKSRHKVWRYTAQRLGTGALGIGRALLTSDDWLPWHAKVQRGRQYDAQCKARTSSRRKVYRVLPPVGPPDNLLSLSLTPFHRRRKDFCITHYPVRNSPHLRAAFPSLATSTVPYTARFRWFQVWGSTQQVFIRTELNESLQSTSTTCTS